MDNKNTIFHYCSLETFFAIITNKCVRLSDLNKTNDYMEKRWTSKLLVEALINKLQEWKVDIDLQEEYWYEDGLDSHLKFYEKIMNEVLYDTKPVLISCFSKEKDVLSQWRAYGQDGTGISIGFNQKLIKNLDKIKTKNNVWVKDIIYREKKQREEVEDCIEACMWYMQRLFDSDKFKSTTEFKEYFRNEFDVFCEVLPEYLEQISCFIKNPAFKEEKEVRIIYDTNLKGVEFISEDNRIECFETIRSCDKFNISPIKFNIRNDKIVAYADLDFSNMIEEGVIEEIVIGPKSNISEEDIIYLLYASGYNIDQIRINRSMATYR